MLDVGDHRMDAGDRVQVCQEGKAEQVAVLEQVVVDLLVEASAGGDVAPVLDVAVGEIEQVDQRGQALLLPGGHAREPGFVFAVAQQPHERLAQVAIAFEHPGDDPLQRIELLVVDEGVHQQPARLQIEETGVDRRPVRDLLAHVREEVLAQLIVVQCQEQFLQIVDLSEQVGELPVDIGGEVGMLLADLLYQEVARDHLIVGHRVRLQEPAEVGEHLAEVLGVGTGVLQVVLQDGDPSEERLFRRELVERLLLVGDRGVAHHVRVQLLLVAAEGRVGLQNASRRRAPLGPLGGGQNTGDELHLDALHVGLIAETPDDGTQGRRRIALDAVPQPGAGGGGLLHPEVVPGQDLQCADGHLQRHPVVAFLGKVDGDLIIVDRGDSPYAPTAVEHEVAGVEGDVLLEVRDRFLGVAPRLSQVGNAQVLVQVAVAGVLLGIRLGDLGARLRVLRLIAQNALEDLDGGVPVLLLVVVGIQRLQKRHGPFLADRAGDLALELQIELRIVRPVLDQALPHLLDVRVVPLVDIAVQRLAVIIDRAVDVARLLAVAGEHLDEVRLLVVDAYQPLVHLEFRRFLVLVVVALGERSQREAVLSELEDAVAQILDDIPLVVVGEDVHQQNQVGVVHQSAADRHDAGQVQGDDAVAIAAQVLFAELQQLRLAVFLPRFRQQAVEFDEVGRHVAVQRSSGPLFLIEQLGDLGGQAAGGAIGRGPCRCIRHGRSHAYLGFGASMWHRHCFPISGCPYQRLSPSEGVLSFDYRTYSS